MPVATRDRAVPILPALLPSPRAASARHAEASGVQREHPLPAYAGWYDQAGLEGGSSHSGRRWFITRLAHAGISPKAIMMLAGHRHLSTTQRYIDVNDDMMRSAVEILS